MNANETMNKSSSSSDKSKTTSINNTSSSSDRIDEETNNFYEQCSISSSLSSTESSNNFPNIQISEMDDQDGEENESSAENEFESPLPRDTSPPSSSNKFRLAQNRKEFDDPFLRDLTACLQMKQKKVCYNDIFRQYEEDKSYFRRFKALF